MNISFSPPDITNAEIQAVINVLQSGWITTGPKTKEFEKKIAQFVHSPKAVCLNSATACMELTLRLLGVGPGDEVITSAYTYTASASVICHVGAKPVLVDTAPDSFEMDYDQVEKAITSKTKVIIPVDLAGVMCNYNRIYEIIKSKQNLFCPQNKIQEIFNRIIILADAAHAFGSSLDGRMCGEVADFTSFSFHAVKNLTTGEGGAIVWRSIPGIKDEWLYQQYMLLSLHGQSKDALTKTQAGSWEYDIVEPNYKCNMTDIMAAIGVSQLERYSDMLAHRKKIIKRYDTVCETLPVKILNHLTKESVSSGHLYLVRINEYDSKQRNILIRKMAEHGIATNVHYKPLPMLTAYQNMGFKIDDYPNSYYQYQNEISLPLHSSLTAEQVEYVIKTFKILV
ncbi:DegT/DnrJ/EryC1/StrS family aminotransferase [Clostridiaceae bacterium]|nr:DegT/DnrJ/EryC1/StrS family aminotransferase [Clostridiaceae bacterium]NBH34015.1 DegT/DnrJ/EryC1/StrS family aminotransferase [Clostridiaceae bacterium]